MYCYKCGAEIDEEAVICPKCGCATKNYHGQAAAFTAGSAQTRRRDDISRKSRLVSLLLCIFVGYLGVHRFYIGKVGMGILYLFTGGLLGIGWLIDIIMIACGNMTDATGRYILDWQTGGAPADYCADEPMTAASPAAQELRKEMDEDDVRQMRTLKNIRTFAVAVIVTVFVCIIVMSLIERFF